MFDSLVTLFHSDKLNMKMILRNKLILVKISRYGNVTSYIMRINQVRDQISIIGEELDDK